MLFSRSKDSCFCKWFRRYCWKLSTLIDSVTRSLAFWESMVGTIHVDVNCIPVRFHICAPVDGNYAGFVDFDLMVFSPVNFQVLSKSYQTLPMVSVLWNLWPPLSMPIDAEWSKSSLIFNRLPPCLLSLSPIRNSCPVEIVNCPILRCHTETMYSWRFLHYVPLVHRRILRF